MTIAPLNPQAYQGQALISLTYDDGRKSNFDVALPLHQEFNIRAGFAIIAGRALDPEYWDRYMAKELVTEASRQGIEIYSHSFSHPHLSKLDAAGIELEMKQSQDVLNNMIDPAHQAQVSAICIPFSETDKTVLATAQKYYSLTRGKGDKFTSLSPEKNKAMVYSFGLHKDTTFDDVKALIDKAVAEKAWLTLMLHGTIPQAIPEQREYDIDASLLRQILGYIKGIGEEKLLPINLSDIHGIRAKVNSPKV